MDEKKGNANEKQHLCNGGLVGGNGQIGDPIEPAALQSSANAGAVDPPYLYLADKPHGIRISAPLQDH